VLTQGLRWLLDSGSPFYVAPRPSPELARWLWLFRAACTADRARASMPVLRELNVAGAALHEALAREGGEQRWLYRRNGIVQLHATAAGGEAAASELDELRGLGVLATELSAADVRERYPDVRCAITHAVSYDEAAHLDPCLFTAAVGELAATAGARVVTDAEALALEPAGSGAVRVVTTRGEFSADQVVLAAGAWTPALTRSLGMALPVEPAKGYSIDMTRPAAFPDVPLYLGEAHLVMTPLGGTLRLGGTLELSGWDMRVRRKRVDGLRLGAARALGVGLREPEQRLWRGPRPVTPDGLPVIGRVPRHERVILATGHCMLGLMLAPVTGKVVAELAGGAHTSMDLAPLTPARFM
jgi:D-amino-acid dehydrogenase